MKNIGNVANSALFGNKTDLEALFNDISNELHLVPGHIDAEKHVLAADENGLFVMYQKSQRNSEDISELASFSKHNEKYVDASSIVVSNSTKNGRYFLQVQIPKKQFERELEKIAVDRANPALSFSCRMHDALIRNKKEGVELDKFYRGAGAYLPPFEGVKLFICNMMK